MNTRMSSRLRSFAAVCGIGLLLTGCAVYEDGYYDSGYAGSYGGYYGGYGVTSVNVYAPRYRDGHHHAHRRHREDGGHHAAPPRHSWNGGGHREGGSHHREWRRHRND